VPTAPSRVTPDRAEAALDVGAPSVPTPAELVPPRPGPVVAPATVESARDEVEEMVVERSLAGRAEERVAAVDGLAPANGALPGGGNGVHPPDGSAEPARAARRRGRVTRTAGAPTATAGDAPVVAVVTVPAAAAPDSEGPPVASEPAAAAAEPEGAPTGAPPPARPRRPRRAASRPAGPPSVEAAPAPTEGDPV
jgi:ribonuclease E